MGLVKLLLYVIFTTYRSIWKVFRKFHVSKVERYFRIWNKYIFQTVLCSFTYPTRFVVYLLRLAR